MIRRALYFGALAMTLAGCREDSELRGEYSEPALTRQYRAGALTVVMSLSETNIATSGRVTLMIEARAPEGVDPLIPEIGNQIDPFTVGDGYLEPSQPLPNGKHLIRRVWTLLPSLPGESELQPIAISAGADAVETEPIRIAVASLISPEVEGFEIRDIAETIPAAPESVRRKRWIVKTGVAIALLAGLISAIRRRRAPREEIELPPGEAALAALDALPVDELEKTHAINAVLLTFIEGRFNTPVRGGTLTELLPRLRETLPTDSRETLERFLTESEQARFSSKLTVGFANELEAFAREYVTAMKEEPCD